MRITLFHQSAFVLTPRRGGAVAFDLGQEVPGAAVESLRVEASVVSHRHPDHLHLEHLLRLGRPVFGPADVGAVLDGVELPFHVVSPGETFTAGGLALTPFEVDHGPHLSAPVVNLGLLAEADGKRVLFLGDMAADSPTPLGPWDLVLVPVGGSKVFTPEAAAQFIRRIGHTGAVTPIHFHGRSDPLCGARFRELAADSCDVRLMDVGETVAL